MSLKRNLVANYLGQAWTGLIGLAFIPLYVSYLGIESFGLIGLFTLLQTWFTLLDLGMTPTLGREMARFTAGARSAQSIRDLLRSIEVISVGIALLIAALIAMMSSWLAAEWLNVNQLEPESVAYAIALMGGVIALRFVEGLYRGGLMGLQRQVYVNAANGLYATLRAAGAVAVLAWWSPTIEAYFLWQFGVSIASAATFAVAVYRHLPEAPTPARFSRQALAGIRTFAAGMLATSVLAMLLTQVDKVLLSRLLMLEEFGYYTLAATVAAAIYLLVTPVTQSFYPRLTELSVSGDARELARVYHRGAWLVTVLATPGALMLVVFGEHLILVWSGDPNLAARVAPLLTLLACGTLLNGYMYMPYMLQLANGWTSLAVRINFFAVAGVVPTILWITPRYGALGAAWVWVGLNLLYLLVGVQLMHRRLLSEEKWSWYWHDVLAPGLTIAAYLVLARQMMPDGIGRWQAVPWLAGVALVAGVGIWLALRARPFHGASGS